MVLRLAFGLVSGMFWSGVVGLEGVDLRWLDGCELAGGRLAGGDLALRAPPDGSPASRMVAVAESRLRCCGR